MSTAHILFLAAFALATACNASAAYEAWHVGERRLTSLLVGNALVFLLLFFATLYS